MIFKSLFDRFFESDASVRRVIVLIDILFLLSICVIGFCWWEVRTTVTVFGCEFPFKWRDNQLWIPLLLLVIRGVVSSGAGGLNRDVRLGLFRHWIVSRLVMIYLSVMIPCMVADAILKRTKIDIQIAPIVLDSHVQKEEFFGRTREMLKDPDLVWKFIPNSAVYGHKINSLGFREREVNPLKAPGVRRVICLGDSVTAQGQPGYSQYLHDMLTNAPPDGGKWEAFNMGVYGYSSLQGLRLFQLQVKDLKPDIVTVSFGRNDHTQLEDSDNVKMAANLSPAMKNLYAILGRRTLGRLILHAFDRGHVWTLSRSKEKKEERVTRVPAEDFRNIMRQFVREIRAIGATPILITAPRNTKVPHDYVDNNLAHSTEEFIHGHDMYAEIIREVCRETGATLVDMQKFITGPEWENHFARDAIHLDFYDREGGMMLGSEEQPALRYFAKQLYLAIKDLPSKPGPK